ncbi:hypothetical protein KKG29_03905 [Patescibacteria group bacterium]|nr:hypothetical protein [Patescibacteria group bacterium]MBU4000289.1 hypothetical protein [Patescibacteria group bacterium]MBU4057099.1 hypothetical protein [Patescibacteria group bacterium]MBU4368477.1 hypothetical protein [Patescibacteria group bacterium]
MESENFSFLEPLDNFREAEKKIKEEKKMTSTVGIVLLLGGCVAFLIAMEMYKRKKTMTCLTLFALGAGSLMGAGTEL